MSGWSLGGGKGGTGGRVCVSGRGDNFHVVCLSTYLIDVNELESEQNNHVGRTSCQKLRWLWYLHEC